MNRFGQNRATLRQKCRDAESCKDDHTQDVYPSTIRMLAVRARSITGMRDEMVGGEPVMLSYSMLILPHICFLLQRKWSG